MCKELRPALVEAREKEMEKEEEQNMTMGHADNGPIVPEATGQDEHDTAPVPAQSSQIVPLDDEPDSLDYTQVDTQPDSQGQPVNHPPTLDEHALFIGSGKTEVLEPPSGASIPQSEPKAKATMPFEIEEVLSTPESKPEGS